MKMCAFLATSIEVQDDQSSLMIMLLFVLHFVGHLFSRVADYRPSSIIL